MISKEEVERIARLSRLKLTDEEIIKMQKDMSAILDYFEVLKTAGTGQHPVLTESQHRVFPDLRKDEAVLNRDISNKLVSQAPDKKDGYIKVKTIL